MKRRFLNSVTIISLLLCLGTLGMWARSYRVGERWAMRRDHTAGGVSKLFRGTVDSTRGAVEIIVEHGTARDVWPDDSYQRHSSGRAYRLPFGDADETTLERLGMRYSRESCYVVHGMPTPNGKSTKIDFPYWFPAAILGAMPMRWWHLRRKRAEVKV